MRNREFGFEEAPLEEPSQPDRPDWSDDEDDDPRVMRVHRFPLYEHPPIVPIERIGGVREFSKQDERMAGL